MVLDLLVEGYVDEAVATCLLCACGHEAGTTYGKRGWTYIEQKVRAFDLSCGKAGLLTLVDFMDTRLSCPPSVVSAWLPRPSAMHVFRVVVHEIESWVLADRDAIASFLGVPKSKIPHDPDILPDPKRTLINLARTSRKRALAAALVPVTDHAATEGPLYSSEIVRFVREQWSPERARIQSSSLDRCMKRLSQLSM
ncbi:MAG: hypothetical protein V4582_04205 [Pseudomonadota bacterium]